MDYLVNQQEESNKAHELLISRAVPENTLSYQKLMAAILNELQTVIKSEISVHYQTNRQADIMSALILIPYENCAVHVQHSYNKTVKTQATILFISKEIETVVALHGMKSVVFKRVSNGMEAELPSFAKDVLAAVRSEHSYRLGSDFVEMLRNSAFKTDAGLNSILGTLFFQTETLSPNQASLLKGFLHENPDMYGGNKCMLTIYNMLLKSIFDTAPKSWLKDHMALATLYCSITSIELPEVEETPSKPSSEELPAIASSQDASVNFDEIEEAEVIEEVETIDDALEEEAKEIAAAVEKPKPNTEMARKGNGLLSGMFAEKYNEKINKTSRVVSQKEESTEVASTKEEIPVNKTVDLRNWQEAVAPEFTEEKIEVIVEEREEKANAVAAVEEQGGIDFPEEDEPIEAVEETDDVDPEEIPENITEDFDLIESQNEFSDEDLELPMAETYEDPAFSDESFSVDDDAADMTTTENVPEEKPEANPINELDSELLTRMQSYFAGQDPKMISQKEPYLVLEFENGLLIH
jgi:hypothetical protein